ncbi:MAG: ABC transporter ATP-binding protein [Pyrinomonadaceae bacterium]
MAEANDNTIVCHDLSKFYGDVLGINRVSLSINPGITSLVGPNGSGKTTLMNLLTGLLQPSRGDISVLGIPTSDPERLFRVMSYCSQFDSFPRGVTGREFIASYLLVHGFSKKQAGDMAASVLARVGLTEAADRKVAGYSKGMRQKARLAQAIAHGPRVLILDEPLNGLDPMARAETIGLFRTLAADGMFLIISSHILHEVDMMSDSVVLLNNGYVVAEGNVQGVREEMDEHPAEILVRCDRPSLLASKAFGLDSTVEAKIHVDRLGLFVKTRDVEKFYLLMNRLVVDDGLLVESVAPADDDLNAVYQYLIGHEAEGA